MGDRWFRCTSWHYPLPLHLPLASDPSFALPSASRWLSVFRILWHSSRAHPGRPTHLCRLYSSYGELKCDEVLVMTQRPSAPSGFGTLPWSHCAPGSHVLRWVSDHSVAHDGSGSRAVSSSSNAPSVFAPPLPGCELELNGMEKAS